MPRRRQLDSWAQRGHCGGAGSAVARVAGPMMAAMRGAGVALGDRNKLRLLASQQTSERAVLSDHEQDFRRTQAEESNIDRQADVRPDSATTQARERQR